MIRTSQVLELGFSKATLTNYVKAGLLERISHGVYRLPDSVEDDLFSLALRFPKIIFSHNTALFLNDMSDRTPFRHYVTIPNGSSLSASVKRECVCFYIKQELYLLGMVERKTTFGNAVRCYDRERTICDLLRSRTRIDEETVVQALKNYASSNAKNIHLLSSYAEQLHVEKILKNYMEVLL